MVCIYGGYQCGCWELHKTHQWHNETSLWLVLISPHEEKHHNKCHLAFWSSGCSDESPVSAFKRALLSFFVVNCDTVPNSKLYAWFPCRHRVHYPWARLPTQEEFTKLAREECCVILFSKFFILMWTMSSSGTAHCLLVHLQQNLLLHSVFK